MNYMLDPADFDQDCGLVAKRHRDMLLFEDVCGTQALSSLRYSKALLALQEILSYDLFANPKEVDFRLKKFAIKTRIAICGRDRGNRIQAAKYIPPTRQELRELRRNYFADVARLP